MSFHVPNQFRIRSEAGSYSSDDTYGNNGAFYVPNLYWHKLLLVIASDEFEWEHVSASLENRCPNWNEMCYLKDLFWDPEDSVIQIHPPKSKYVNKHPYCLHLWRPIKFLLPLPNISLL